MLTGKSGQCATAGRRRRGEGKGHSTSRVLSDLPPPPRSPPALFTCLNSVKGPFSLLLSLSLCLGAGGVTTRDPCLSWGQQAEKRPVKLFYHRFSWCSPTNMASKLCLALSFWLLLSTSEGGKQMPKLSAKKLCADSDCSRE